MKEIGNIGEAKTLSKFVELGIPVYLPFGDNEKSDLIIDLNNKLYKVQVKTSIKAENGKINFDLFHKKKENGKKIKKPYSKEEVDFFVCYNLERDKLFLIPLKLYNKTKITIRHSPPNNNQLEKSKMECDFLLENMIDKIKNNIITI